MHFGLWLMSFTFCFSWKTVYFFTEKIEGKEGDHGSTSKPFQVFFTRRIRSKVKEVETMAEPQALHLPLSMELFSTGKSLKSRWSCSLLCKIWNFSFLVAFSSLYPFFCLTIEASENPFLPIFLQTEAEVGLFLFFLNLRVLEAKLGLYTSLTY